MEHLPLAQQWTAQEGHSLIEEDTLNLIRSQLINTMGLEGFFNCCRLLQTLKLTAGIQATQKRVLQSM